MSFSTIASNSILSTPSYISFQQSDSSVNHRASPVVIFFLFIPRIVPCSHLFSWSSAHRRLCVLDASLLRSVFRPFIYLLVHTWVGLVSPDHSKSGFKIISCKFYLYSSEVVHLEGWCIDSYSQYNPRWCVNSLPFSPGLLILARYLRLFLCLLTFWRLSRSWC